MKPPTSVRTAARSRARHRATRNRHNRPMKNHPVVAPKDRPVGPKDLLVDQRDRPVDRADHLVGPQAPPADRGDHPAGPEDHLAKNRSSACRQLSRGPAPSTKNRVLPTWCDSLLHTEEE